MSKSYELSLPVFKQGDDLHHQIDQAKGNLREAFEAQAECYLEAARICKRMAGVAAEMPELRVDANTHIIFVDYEGGSNTGERLDQLVREELLTVRDWEDEDFDEEDEDDEEDEEDGDEEDDDTPAP
jgi:hypothetical protein